MGSIRKLLNQSASSAVQNTCSACRGPPMKMPAHSKIPLMPSHANAFSYLLPVFLLLGKFCHGICMTQWLIDPLTVPQGIEWGTSVSLEACTGCYAYTNYSPRASICKRFLCYLCCFLLQKVPFCEWHKQTKENFHSIICIFLLIYQNCWHCSGHDFAIHCE